MRNLIADIRIAYRGLARARGFSLIVIAVLAIGIGANTAIFTVVNTVLLHPLPYPDSDRIVTIMRSEAGGANSIPMFSYWMENNPGFEDLSAYQPGMTANIAGGDLPEQIQALKVSARYIHLLGAKPILGRTFTADEDRPDDAHVLVMSDGLWRRQFGGDSSVLGKSLTLGGTTYEVIGVLGRGFKPYPPADVWIPLQADPDSTDHAHVLNVAGRLPKDMSLAQANAKMAVLGKQYAQSHPAQLGNDDKVSVQRMEDQIVGDARGALLILLGAVGLVLLIACANVSNLLLARGTIREKEIAIRLAIGAHRSHIVRQLLVENVLLAGAGGILGLIAGSWALPALLAFAPGGLPRIEEMAPIPALDPWIAGFTLLLSGLTGIGFGFFPALRASRRDAAYALQQSGGRSGTGFKRNRILNALTVAEVATAVVLLCGSLLLIRSFVALHNVDLGFDPRQVLTMELSLNGANYSTSAELDRFQRQFLERVQQIPGVEAAAMASALPLSNRMDMIVDIPGRPAAAGHKFTGDVLLLSVSPQYFSTLHIPLISGTSLDDQPRTRRTVLINQTMARMFWPGEDPVGHSIRIGPGLGPHDQGSVEIVGIVGDVREQLNSEPPLVMYESTEQLPDSTLQLIAGMQPAGLIIRTTASAAPSSVGPAVQQALLQFDKLPMVRVLPLEQLTFDSTARHNFNTMLLTLFSVIALVLAAAGIYAVMSYAVAQRTHEMGIRAALGANRSALLRLVVTDGIRLAVVGAVIGIAASLGLTGFIQGQLFKVSPFDPFTLTAAPVILVVIAIIAALVPALRASRIDPFIALRNE
jgi:predicted permease